MTTTKPAAILTAGQRKRRRTGYFWAQVLVQLLFLVFFRGRVFGVKHIPKRGGALLVSNHQSFLDPPLATLAIPRECEYMARDTLWKTAWLAKLMDYLNAFPVKRGTADTRAIKELIRRLRAGGLILTFPEATRTTDGTIGEMRPGVVLVARKTAVPIVPVLILGAFESWPRTAKLPRPHPVIIAYGEPLYPHRHPEWTDEDCIRIVRERILTLQKRYQGHPLLHGRA